MSFLNSPRLAFSGLFQADPSTVNNDPRHFDNATFESRFQQFQTKQAMNGWWNPAGTAIFRLSGCSVQAAFGPDGEECQDPVVGFKVGNSPDQPAAKLVDLDPDWQLASQIYGLSISLVEPRTGKVVMLGDFESAPFRDLWFTRGGGAGDSGASAMWQTHLTNLRWDLEGVDSPFLVSLFEAADHGPLSIRLTTFACSINVSAPDFTYGTLLGAIGPVCPGEPKTFIAGRRFMPLNGTTSNNGITCFSGWVDSDAGTLAVDLSNALPTENGTGVKSLGNLHFVVLRQPEAAQDTQIGSDDYVEIGPLDQSDNGLYKYNGIHVLNLSSEARQLVGDHPLALAKLGPSGSQGPAVICVRENQGGREVRAETFSFRLDPNDPQRIRRSSRFFATQYGSPLCGARNCPHYKRSHPRCRRCAGQPRPGCDSKGPSAIL